jgi:hypothetical protein
MIGNFLGTILIYIIKLQEFTQELLSEKTSRELNTVQVMEIPCMAIVHRIGHLKAYKTAFQDPPASKSSTFFQGHNRFPVNPLDLIDVPHLRFQVQGHIQRG